MLQRQPYFFCVCSFGGNSKWTETSVEIEGEGESEGVRSVSSVYKQFEIANNPMTVQDWASEVSPDTGVPLGKGPPTMDELREYYPPKFTWSQLKTFINSGSAAWSASKLLVR